MKTRARALVLVLCAVSLSFTLPCAAPLGADPVELPADVPEGADHALEPADTLATGELELGLGLAGGSSRAVERRRRVRFTEPDLSGTVREGAGDPLAGGSIEARAAAGELVAGKLAPRWGRGLLLGSPGDPWQRAAIESGATGLRGRTGEGVLYRPGHGAAELLVGRFAHRDLAGLRGGLGALSLGVLGDRRGAAQSSLGLARGGGAGEIVLDRRGAWRAEGLLSRGGGAWTLAACVRAGSASLRSLAEPGRSGPARAAVLSAAGETPLGSLQILSAAWRFRAGRAGARLALELARPLGSGAALAAGFEEQHGVRRESQRETGLRQGAWLEWSRPAEPLGLSLRHETWGARGGLREAVRVASSVRIEARMPGGIEAALGHCVFRVRRGENLYLREAESDRLMLRALSGEGQRTRLDLSVRLARGTLHATWHLADVTGRPEASRWALEWVRHSRTGGARPP